MAWSFVPPRTDARRAATRRCKPATVRSAIARFNRRNSLSESANQRSCTARANVPMTSSLPPDSAYPSISSLAAIGDGYSLALVGPDARIEWYCPLRFDSHPLLWPLLDRGRGGVLRIAPAGPVETRVRYLPGTAVLEFEWRGADGEALAQIGMAWPNSRESQEILWLIEGRRGRMDLDVSFRPSPGFGRDRTVRVDPGL
jgi:hypothetical protein